MTLHHHPYLDRPRLSEAEVRAANGNYANVTQLRIARTSREAGQEHVPLTPTKRRLPWLTIVGEVVGFLAIIAATLAFICVFGGQG